MSTRHDPDVMCTAEAVVSIMPPDHSIEADSNYGYKHDGNRRKVILRSKSDWHDIDTIGDDEMPTGRFASGVTQGICFIGGCVPWRDAHVKTGKKNKRPWEEHLSYCAGLKRVIERYTRECNPICVLGDFNQRIPRALQTERVFDSMLRPIPPFFQIITKGIQDSDGMSSIDHIAISNDLATGAVNIIPRIASDGTRLSDPCRPSCYHKIKYVNNAIGLKVPSKYLLPWS